MGCMVVEQGLALAVGLELGLLQLLFVELVLVFGLEMELILGLVLDTFVDMVVLLGLGIVLELNKIKIRFKFQLF